MKKLLLAGLISTIAVSTHVSHAVANAAFFDYKPLITGCYFMPSKDGVVCSIEQNAFVPKTNALYVLYKANDGVIDVKEYCIRRYPGSAALKNPFFKPEKGFRGNKAERPLIIQQFAEYIRGHFSALSENHHGNMMVQLFFYADADELAYYNKSFKERVRTFFKGSATKPEHALIATLRNVQGTQITVVQNDTPFNQANIFVAQNVTLEDLKSINEHITMIDNQFYVATGTTP